MAFKMKKFSGFGNSPIRKEEEKTTSTFDKFSKIGKMQADTKKIAKDKGPTLKDAILTNLNKKEEKE
jgi:hypothetical protein